MNRNIYSSGTKSTFGQRSFGQGRAASAMAQNVQERQSADASRNMRLAMAYVPNQRFENLYSPSDALSNGTLFGDLNLPYCMGGRR